MRKFKVGQRVIYDDNRYKLQGIVTGHFNDLNVVTFEKNLSERATTFTFPMRDHWASDKVLTAISNPSFIAVNPKNKPKAI